MAAKLEIARLRRPSVACASESRVHGLPRPRPRRRAVRPLGGGCRGLVGLCAAGPVRGRYPLRALGLSLHRSLPSPVAAETGSCRLPLNIRSSECKLACPLPVLRRFLAISLHRLSKWWTYVSAFYPQCTAKYGDGQATTKLWTESCTIRSDAHSKMFLTPQDQFNPATGPRHVAGMMPQTLFLHMWDCRCCGAALQRT